MKIIYVENVRIPSERAHAYQIVQTCAWFARFGHEVVLVNPDRANGQDVFTAYHLAPDLFSHVRLPVLDPLSWNWFIWKKIAYAIQRWSFARILCKWIASQKADVWYTRDPAMADVLRGNGRRIILELHHRPNTQENRWQRIKDEIAGFVVITQGLKDLLITMGIDANRIHVAPDGYDPKDFERLGSREEERKKLGLPQDAFVAIYIGGLYLWKGVDFVVRAWDKTPENTHLVIVGGPEQDRRRLEHILDSTKNRRVHVYPTVDHQKAIQMLALGDVGLLTSSPEYEIGRVFTSPLKQFEYLAAGLPILASDVSSSHEILTENVARFYKYQKEDFVAKIQELETDVEWMLRARERGPGIVKLFAWESRVNSILLWLKERNVV